MAGRDLAQIRTIWIRGPDVERAALIGLKRDQITFRRIIRARRFQEGFSEPLRLSTFKRERPKRSLEIKEDGLVIRRDSGRDIRALVDCNGLGSGCGSCCESCRDGYESPNNVSHRNLL